MVILVFNRLVLVGLGRLAGGLSRCRGGRCWHWHWYRHCLPGRKSLPMDQQSRVRHLIEGVPGGQKLVDEKGWLTCWLADRSLNRRFDLVSAKAITLTASVTLPRAGLAIMPAEVNKPAPMMGTPGKDNNAQN